MEPKTAAGQGGMPDANDPDAAQRELEALLTERTELRARGEGPRAQALAPRIAALAARLGLAAEEVADVAPAPEDFVGSFVVRRGAGEVLYLPVGVALGLIVVGLGQVAPGVAGPASGGAGMTARAHGSQGSRRGMRARMLGSFSVRRAMPLPSAPRTLSVPALEPHPSAAPLRPMRPCGHPRPTARGPGDALTGA
jgi:hypothetical protein